jgi:hypothetical protein
MLANNKKTAIFQRLLEHCEPSARKPLSFLEVDGDVWQGSSDPEQVASLLAEEFSTEDLVASGVVTVTEDGSVELMFSLSGDGGRFIALRDATTGEPYELLTGDGCVSSGALPVFEILRDAHTRQCLNQGNGDLFVAFEIEDVILLRACGLPATLAVGLDDLPLEDVDQFCETFGLTSIKYERARLRKDVGAEHRNPSEYLPDNPFARHVQRDTDGGPPAGLGQLPDTAVQPSSCPTAQRVQLVLLGWLPSSLSNAVPCQLKVVVDYFHQLDRFMDVELYELGLWEPNEETVARLRFIAARRSATIFQDAFLAAADEIGAGVDTFGKVKPKLLGPPANYPAAIARLQEATSSDQSSHLLGPDRQKHAWRDVQRFLSQQIINPIREYALATSDPIERTLLMGIAELSHVFHIQTVLISEKLNRRISERGVERVDPLPDDQLKNLLAMADRLINFAKVTDQCSQPRKTIIQSTAIESKSIPRLPHSV